MNKLATLGIVLLLLTACSGRQSLSASASPKASTAMSPGPAASAGPSSSDIASPARTEPSVLAPVGPVGLHAQCRLPVYWWDSDTSTQDHAGFVTFPSGQLVVDRSAPPAAQPHFFFYDRAFAKWIFAVRDWVSPDGRQYAYAEGDPLSGTNESGKLHVVDVATGTDRVIYNGFIPGVVQFTAEGIYFTKDQGEGFRNGLWLIAPQGGRPRLINSTIYQPVVANGAAWGLAFNAADPNPASGGIADAHNTILRFDLNTGAAATWWYHPENDMRLFDGDYSGNLYVDTFREQSGDSSLADWMLDSRGTAHLIGSVGLTDLAAVDSNGVWFDDAQSGPTSYLWLFANGRFDRVAGYNVSTMRVAGGCIPGA